MQSKSTDYTILEDLSFSEKKANIFSLGVLSATFIIYFSLFLSFHPFIVLKQAFWQYVLELWYSIPILLEGIIIHEIIHFLCLWLIAKVDRKEIQFGLSKKSLTPYVHSKTPVKIVYYRLSAFAPFVFLGFVPFIISLFLGSGGLLIFGIIFTFTAAGDILILLKIRHLSKGEFVLDHPHYQGCLHVQLNQK